MLALTRFLIMRLMEDTDGAVELTQTPGKRKGAVRAIVENSNGPSVPKIGQNL